MRAIMGLLGFALAFSGVTAALNAPVILPTESGLVQGVIEGDVRAFRGIPFAAPPVGELRWRPPVAPRQWSGIRDASTFGNVCPQLDFSGNPIGDEDCLVLNIYTAANLDPKKGDPNKAQPVMVFFHGGGDRQGSTQDPPYGSAPTPLATHGVIVVTAEYRLGPLGFFLHPLLAKGSSGNYALMDQIAALAWVQRNIRCFGGDPERVMAFGQSSGAADVQALLASPASRGLFSRAGIESDAIVANEAKSLETAEANQAPLVGLVGCDNGAPDVLACLRGVPASVLVTIEFAVPIDLVLEPRVLPEDPFAVLQREGSPVPLLIGSTREEATGVTFFGDLTQPISPEQYAADIHAQFDIFGPIFHMDVADQVLKLYPASAYDAPNWGLVAVDSDFGVNICAVRNAARAALGPVQNPNLPQYAPVWRYLFTHRFENDASLNALRAYHTAELYFLFGNFNPVSAPNLGVNYTPTSTELALSSAVMGYWTRFAAKGDPNGPGAFHWPRYSAHDQILQLDVTPARLVGYHNPQCDFFTPILNTMCLKFPGFCTSP